MNFNQKTISTLLTFLAVSTLAACGSSNKQIPKTTSTSTPPTTSVNDVVLRDYRAFWDDYLAVTNPMSPGNPRIAAHATGDELSTLNSVVVAGSASGTVFRGSAELAPSVSSVVGDTATVKDCYFDHSGQYDVKTGERKDKEDTERQLVYVTMKLIDGVWKVASIDHRGIGCAPDQ